MLVSSLENKKFIGMIVGILLIAGIAIGIYFATRKPENSSMGSNQLTEQVFKNITDSEMTSASSEINYQLVPFDQLKESMIKFIDKMNALNLDQKNNLKNKITNTTWQERDKLLVLFMIVRALEYFSIFKKDIMPKTGYKFDDRVTTQGHIVSTEQSSATSEAGNVDVKFLKDFVRTSWFSVVCAYQKERKKSSNNDLLNALFFLVLSFESISIRQPITNHFEMKDGKYKFKGDALNDLKAKKIATEPELSQPMSLGQFSQIFHKYIKTLQFETLDCKIYDANTNKIIEILMTTNIKDLPIFEMHEV